MQPQMKQRSQLFFTIVSVTVKVKFPCKMTVEHQGNILTQEVSSNPQCKFVFNQPVNINFEQAPLDFTLQLLTDKGARYIGGIVKLTASDISQGLKTISVSKCIDTQAYADLNITKVVWAKRDSSVYSKQKTSAPTNNRNNAWNNTEGPQRGTSPFGLKSYQIAESRSACNYPLTTQIRNSKLQWETKSRHPYVPPRDHRGSRTKSPAREAIEQSRVSYGMKSSMMDREKAVQAQAYKEGYQKLREKLRKQAQNAKQERIKRVQLQAVEDKLKLQIVRMRLKTQELERNVAQKTQALKQMHFVITKLKQKQNQLQYFRAEADKRQQQAHRLSQANAALQQNIQQLRLIATNQHIHQSETVRQLRIEIQQLNMQLCHQHGQSEQQRKYHAETLRQKDKQFFIKKQQVQKLKRLINDFQAQLQNKNFQFDRLIQAQKTVQKDKQDEFQKKLASVQQQLTQTIKSGKTSQKKTNQLNSTITKMEYEIKLLNQQLQWSKSELGDAKIQQQKFNNLSRQCTQLIHRNQQLEMRIQKQVINGQQTQNLIKQQADEQIKKYKQLSTDLQQQCRGLKVRVHELQLQASQQADRHERFNRQIDGVRNQLNDVKNRQKQAKNTIKNKQDQSLRMETQYATAKQKLKNIDQIYKLQQQKLQHQVQNVTLQMQQEKAKAAKATQENNKFNQQITILTNKNYSLQQQIDNLRNQISLKDTQTNQMIQEHFEIVTELDKTISQLNLANKQYQQKVQRYELDQLKTTQNNQSQNKNIKLLQEKCQILQNAQKSVNNQLNNANQTISTLQTQVQQYRALLVESKNQLLATNGKVTKLSKMVEMLQPQIARIKQERNQVSGNLQTVQQNLAVSNGKLKNKREKIAQLQMKQSVLTKQIQKNTAFLWQNIGKYIVPLNGYHKKHLSNQLSQIQQNFPQKDSGMTAGIAYMVAQGKLLKQNITNLCDKIRNQQIDNERLTAQLKYMASKVTASQGSHKQELEGLQRNRWQLQVQRQKQIDELNEAIIALKQEIKQRIFLQEDLQAQIQELNFTVQSQKNNYDALTDQHSKQMNALRNSNLQLQNNLKIQHVDVIQLQQRNRATKEELQSCQAELQTINEYLVRAEKETQKWRKNSYEAQSQYQKIRASEKYLIGKIEDLQFQLQNIKSTASKLQGQLQQQYYKYQQLNTLTNDLVKHKEHSIKRDIDKDSELAQAQNTIISLQVAIQRLTQKNQRYNNLINGFKDSSKNMNSSINTLEVELSDAKSKCVYLERQLAQKNQEIAQKDQYFTDSENKAAKKQQQAKKTITDLQQELSRVIHKNLNQVKQLQQKIVWFQNELQKTLARKTTLEASHISYQEEIFILKDQLLKSKDKIQDKETVSASLRATIQQLQQKIQELNCQIKQKQQKNFEISNLNYHLQNKLEATINQLNQQLIDIDQNWQKKYNYACDQYQQRLNIAQMEHKYIIESSQDKDNQITKLTNQLKMANSNDSQVRTHFEQIIKSMQDQKLAMISNKQSQIQRMYQETKTKTDSLKQKELQLRRITNELQIARRTIVGCEQKWKQVQENVKNSTKIYQVQIQQLRKKEVQHKAYKEAVYNQNWNTERQLKKVVQAFVSNFIQINSSGNSPKVLELVRGLESTLSGIFSSIITQAL